MLRAHFVCGDLFVKVKTFRRKFYAPAGVSRNTGETERRMAERRGRLGRVDLGRSVMKVSKRPPNAAQSTRKAGWRSDAFASAR